MWRAIFFGGGLFVASWGGSFLMVDRMVLTMETAPAPIQRQDDVRGLFITRGADNKAEFNPPEWAAFTLISVGAVTMLYAIALPKRNRS